MSYCAECAKAEKELAESKRREEKMQKDFNRRTDILNNHIAREKVLDGRVKTLEDALGEHHKWHLGIGAAFFKEPDGEMVEIDLTDAYCDSSLYGKTQQALAAKEPKA